MTGERAFERERDWTQGPAKWAAAVVLGGACILTSAWVIAGRVPVAMAQEARNEPARASGGMAPSAPTTFAAAPTPLPATPAPLADDPIGPPLEPAALAPPTPAETPAATPPPTAESSIARRINLNTATAAELELLPGVGPKLAERIVDHRATHGRFKSINDLDAVNGIGPRIFERLRPLVTVD